MKRALLSLFLFAAALPAVQVFRVDPAPVTTISGTVPVGGYPTLFAVPSASISIYTDAAGTIPATAYTDGTGNTACGVGAPVVQAGTALCSGTTNPQGAFGFWLAGGTYYFTVTTQAGQRFGPYPITAGALGVGTISLANGGTGASLTAATGGMVYSTASAMAISSPAQLFYGANIAGNFGISLGSGSLGSSQLVVTGSYATGSQVMADFGYVTSANNSDSASLRTVAYKNNGTGLVIAAETHTVKNFPASSGFMPAVVAGVHSDVAGNGVLYNVGVYAQSDSSFVTSMTAVRADTAFVAEGAAGWTHLIRYYDTDGSTVLFDVDQYGNMNSSKGFVGISGTSQGLYPTYNVSDSAIGWNFSAGGGEVDYFNSQSTGTSMGFAWYQQTAASAATRLGSLDSSGVFTAASLVSSATASPASGAACTAGRQAWDTGFFYICTATGVWKRVALTGGY